MYRVALGFFLLLCFGRAQAYDFYFTIYHRAPAVFGSLGRDGEDYVFEKKIIHIKAKDDYEQAMKIKQAYVAYLKKAYPGYPERIRQWSKYDDPDETLFRHTYIIWYGNAAKARAERKDKMAAVKKQGFPVVESGGFTYQP